tara:strand:- start:5882 stop:7657 length:1776 start_codon:yes stop_codon:yes gene_type:complete
MGRTLVLDIETNGLLYPQVDRKGVALMRGDHIHCLVAIDADTKEEFVFDKFQDNIQAGIDFLMEADCWIGHNLIGFDIPFMQKYYGLGYRKTIDTLIVSRLMYPDQSDPKFPLRIPAKSGVGHRTSHALKAWGLALGEPKDEYDGGWEHYSVEMRDYCIQDVRTNVAVYEKQLSWINNNAKVIQFETLVGISCYKMTDNGFGFRYDDARELELELLGNKAEAMGKLRLIFPDIVTERYSDKQKDKVTGLPKRLKDNTEVFNPGSPKQVIKRLHTKYGWEAPLNERGTGSVETEVLKDLDFVEIPYLLNYREADKALGMVQDWIRRIDSGASLRIHGNFNHQGTVTGRATHNAPNVAQVDKSKATRRLWYPGIEGYVQVGADLSGLELRCLAEMMYDFDKGAYAEEILNGDIHTANQKAAGLPTRDNAKTFIYGFLYGAGNAKVGEIIGKSAQAGGKIKQQFLNSLPALKQTIDMAKHEFNRNGCVALPDGRRVPVRSEHRALNTKLQGDGAIISKLWLVLAERMCIERFGPDVVKFMAWVHDEIQTACPADIADEVGATLVEAANVAGTKLNFRVPIDAEYDVGEDWSCTH